MWTINNKCDAINRQWERTEKQEKQEEQQEKKKKEKGMEKKK